ncbi:Putative glucose-6-phosphate 1-epimerase [Acaryochloris thomasi RCC1774]|uniref:Putative glucose-6-phosphate 1-epimerase n=1 Tax=Acaryochloris thomasi RCC1774 TaxID=1764569 RepID=A0A2W1JLI5_9CYAN|nr:D-hexose-6-phosphate mutarotase [Acaryochloris thomasi]PZD74240.1 Putative glucose-6-phosphate 1-epimerase [Acaryochloris thomasi RCC1774]
MKTEQLNTQYGIADQLQFIDGKGGFPNVEISNGKAKALISVYGGQILSYQPANEPEDLLFLSTRAYYQQGKAIKGGTPICWPWFGPDPEGLGRASHGFVRNRLWTVMGTHTTEDGATAVTLGVVNTPETTEIWPQTFELSITYTVGETLSIELKTQNTGSQEFSISQALHTYFKIGDINRVQVLGLNGSDYIDKVDGGQQKTQQGVVEFSEECDRIYTEPPAKLIIDDAALDRRINITSEGSKTAVVWNPWVENSASMGDLEDTDYQRLLCVETANAAQDIVNVLPGQAMSIKAHYSIER